MFTHSEIWSALDKIAEKSRLSVSGLSKKAGLDPTSFNKSKRITGNGRPRWPSTESVSKVLSCTDTSIEEFALLLMGRDPEEGVSARIPLIGLSNALHDGYFDDAGFPIGENWHHGSFPHLSDSYAYALEITDDSLSPIYRKGDIIIISPDLQVRRGDRVLARTHDGELLARVLRTQGADTIELAAMGLDPEITSYPTRDIDWMARIVWVSQ